MPVKELFNIKEAKHTITVGELIKILSEVDKNSTIYVSVDGAVCYVVEYDEEENGLYIY